MGAQRRNLGAAVAVFAACGLFECSTPTPVTIFHEVAFAPGGATLVLNASDGVYVAHPPSASPLKATDRSCQGPSGASLSCARMSADGRRIALLTSQQSSSRLYDLDEVAGNGSPGIPADSLTDIALARAASGVLDAAFSPDGAQLLWVRSGEEANTIAVERLSSAGSEVELVHAIPLASGETDPLGAVAITSFGVAYPRPTEGAVELWYQPFDGGAAQGLGTLPVTCEGSAFDAV